MKERKRSYDGQEVWQKMGLIWQEMGLTLAEDRAFIAKKIGVVANRAHAQRRILFLYY